MLNCFPKQMFWLTQWMSFSGVLDPFQHLDWPDSLILSIWWTWNDVFLYFNFNSWLLMLLSHSSYVNKSCVCVCVCSKSLPIFYRGVCTFLFVLQLSVYGNLDSDLLSAIHIEKFCSFYFQFISHFTSEIRYRIQRFHFSKASDINSCKYRQISR